MKRKIKLVFTVDSNGAYCGDKCSYLDKSGFCRLFNKEMLYSVFPTQLGKHMRLTECEEAEIKGSELTKKQFCKKMCPGGDKDDYEEFNIPVNAPVIPVIPRTKRGKK